METLSILLALCEGIVIPHTIGQWCRAIMLSLVFTWASFWTDSRIASDLRPNDTHVTSFVCVTNICRPVTLSRECQIHQICNSDISVLQCYMKRNMFYCTQCIVRYESSNSAVNWYRRILQSLYRGHFIFHYNLESSDFPYGTFRAWCKHLLTMLWITW